MARGNANLRVEVINGMVHLPDTVEVGPLPLMFVEADSTWVLDTEAAGDDLTMDPKPTDRWHSGVYRPDGVYRKKYEWYLASPEHTGPSCRGTAETNEQAERMLQLAHEFWDKELA